MSPTNAVGDELSQPKSDSINEKSVQGHPSSGPSSSAQSVNKGTAGSVDSGEHEDTHSFTISSLWRPALVNPVNGKSKTFPILRIWDIYATAFWLATLGFFVAFLSWFAFSPLSPEAVKKDLKLTADQVINSNMASLGGAVLVRLAAGPACDQYGPRKVLAALLVIGAIPSGLAALVKSIGGLEAVRFFISILGGTFVPTQAYTTAFFDTNVVGTANAFSGGWGNMGGGVTVAVMIGLFERYVKSGYSPHLSWRLCFVSVPVPCLLLVAALILGVGRDHPAGKWSRRHLIGGAAQGHVESGYDEKDSALEQSTPQNEKTQSSTSTSVPITSEPLTRQAFVKIIRDVRVWMCAVCYFLTFGLETAMDAALPGMILALFQSDTFSSVDAAYAASTYGLLNLFARPLGGIMSDVLYSRWGLRAKIYWLLVTAFLQGISLVGLGVYVDHGDSKLGGVIGFIVFMAVTGFAANGAAYGVYSHLQPRNNGTVAGIIGASGNLGGLMYTLIFKYQPGVRALPSIAHPGGLNTLGRKFWIAGIVNSAGVLPFFLVGLRSDAR